MSCFPVALQWSLWSKFFNGYFSWWRQQMETSSALLALCAGNSPVNGEFPTQRPVTRRFDVFFDLHLNKRLSKQSWGWWSETPSSSLWRHCNVLHLGLYSLSGRTSSRRTFLIALKFDRHLDSSAAEIPVKFQSDTIITTSDLAALRLQEILW